MIQTKEIIEYLEQSIEELKLLEQKRTQNEEFEQYVVTKLEQLSKDIDALKKAIL